VDHQEPRKTAQDERCSYDSDNATRWCALGSIYVENLKLGNHCAKACCELLQKAATELFEQNIALVNDFRGHADTLRMFDRAIELSK
jgi:hypothetical protein